MAFHAPPGPAHRISIAALPGPRLALALLVVAASGARLALALGREVQRYLPDEFLYGQLARSLAEGRGLRVLGAPAGTPALLQPILTAPAWLAGDPALAFRLTQGINTVAMALGAVVVYALARSVGIQPWTAVAAAAVALASPDLLYTGYVTADAIAYPLALLAVLAAVRALARPTFLSQGLFLGAAGLATFARLQYAALVIAGVIGAAVLERGRPVSLLRRHGLLVAVPLAGAAAVLLDGGLGRYGSVTSFTFSADALRWIPVSGVLLAVAAGVVIVPGAVAWTVSELFRPTAAARQAFAAVTLTLLSALLVASALFAAETDSSRFFERYLMIGIPLAAVGFCCWAADRRPLPAVSLGVAAIVTVAAARAPISEYAAGQGRADSPLLLAVSRLETALGIGTSSLVVALAVTVAAAIAVAATFGRMRPPVLLAVTAVLLAVVSLGAHAEDRLLSAHLTTGGLGADPGWVDAATDGNVLVIEPPGGDPSSVMLLALRNTSIRDIALLGTEAKPFDGAVRRLAAADDGTLRLDGETVRRPLLLDGSSTTVVLDRSRTIAKAGLFTLVTTDGAAQVGVAVAGLASDGWLGARGEVTLYTTGATGMCRSASLRLTVPAGDSPVRVTVKTTGRDQIVTVAAGKARVLSLPGAPSHVTRVGFTSSPARFVGPANARAVTVRAALETGIAPCEAATG